MSAPARLPLLELLHWIALRPRSYVEAMDAWRSSCPRQTVWEDALLEGFIQVASEGARQQAVVRLTAQGAALLAAAGVQFPPSVAPPPGG